MEVIISSVGDASDLPLLSCLRGHSKGVNIIWQARRLMMYRWAIVWPSCYFHIPHISVDKILK